MLDTLDTEDTKEEVAKVLRKKGWDESNGVWETQGKTVPYTRFSQSIYPENNDWNSYSITITVWAKTCSFEIVESCGEAGMETDSEDRWAMIRTFRVSKVSHSQFLQNSNDLIASVTQLLIEKFNP